MIPVGFAGASSSYSITNSVRLNGTSSYLSRTPGSTGTSRKTWTFSCWIKKNIYTSADMILLSAGTTTGSDSGEFTIGFESNTQFLNIGTSLTVYRRSNMLFRDPSAHGHLVVAFDSTQGTAANRLKVYWNGAELTSWAISNDPAPSQDTAVNNSVVHSIGRFERIAARYFDGYLADTYLIDGQALTPSSFGKTDSNGVWVPIKYSGTYGTNGCKLEFKSTSSNLATSANQINGGTYSGYSTSAPFDGVEVPPGGRTASTTWASSQTAGAVTGAAYIGQNFGVATTVGAARIYQFAADGTAITSVKVQYSSNGSSWSDVSGSPFTVGDGGNTMLFTPVSAQYWRVLANASNAGVWAITELSFYSNAGLGTDTSGNGNNWTVNGSPVQTVDTPTNNYATLNPLWKSPSNTVSNGNLTHVGSSATANGATTATIGITSGKWYWEWTQQTTAKDGGGGVIASDVSIGNDTTAWNSSFWYELYAWSGQKRNNGSYSAYDSFTGTNGDIYMASFDATNGVIWFGRNGAWLGSATLAEIVAGTTTHAAFTGIPNTKTWLPFVESANGCQFTVNFGATAFAYTPPTGFKALCTANLPAVSIKQPSKQFNIALWTGDGGSSKAITGIGFQPDFLWAKNRSYVSGSPHSLSNVVCGVTNALASNTTSAESAGDVLSFDADGFTVKATSNWFINRSGDAIAGWCWKAGGAASSNTAGSVTSQVSVNATAGFSVATFAMPSSGVITVGHGLGAVPSMMILMYRGSSGQSKIVYHTSRGNTKGLQLNATAAEGTYSIWNNTTPTATVATLNGSWAGVAENAVLYCFAEIPGFSKFGSYVGNGSTDGPFVACGFRPRWVMVKRTDAVGQWLIMDAARDTANVVSNYLKAESSNAELAFAAEDFISTGFKVRTSDTSWNASGGTYIFAAFAEYPFGGSNVAPSPAR